jgi:hypothetical protein
MTFDEVLAQVQAVLQREQRVSYRGLKRRFALDDEYVEDLKDELIKQSDWPLMKTERCWYGLATSKRIRGTG